MKRLGLVGVGAWGRRYIAAIGRRRDCRIAAFARASARNEDSLPGVPRYAAWTELLGLAHLGDLDGLIVASNPETQAEITEAAISERVPILVEKPIGLSAETVRRILSRYREAGPKPPVIVDYIHLFAPAYRALRSRIQDVPGTPPVIASIDSEGCNRGPFRAWSSLYDYGSHDLALCLDLLGTDARFLLRDARRLDAADNGDGELFEARFDLDAVTVNMRVGNGARQKVRRFGVTLNDGRELVYDDVRPHPLKLWDQGAPIPVDETPPLDVVVTHFLSLIEGATAAGQWAGSASLELSLRIAEILNVIDTVAKGR